MSWVERDSSANEGELHLAPIAHDVLVFVVFTVNQSMSDFGQIVMKRI